MLSQQALPSRAKELGPAADKSVRVDWFGSKGVPLHCRPLLTWCAAKLL